MLFTQICGKDTTKIAYMQVFSSFFANVQIILAYMIFFY